MTAFAQVLSGVYSPINNARITVGGLPIGVRDDVTGAEIGFTSLKGWYGSPGARGSFQDRVDGHGSFDSQVYRSARVITVSGWLGGPDRATVAGLLHLLNGVIPEGQLGEFAVDDPDYGNLSAMVRLTGEPDDSWDQLATRADFQVQFTAPDPLKYGPPLSVGTNLPAPAGGLTFPLFQTTGRLEFGAPGMTGRITVTNPGTAATSLVFTITGPVLGGFVLTDVDSGRRIVYAGDVPSGATALVIDTAYGSAKLNGAERSGELTVKQWWPVPGRGTCTVQFNTLGPVGQSGSMTASLSPAYW